MAACKTTTVVTLSPADLSVIAQRIMSTSERHLCVAIMPTVRGWNMRYANGFAYDKDVSQIP